MKVWVESYKNIDTVSRVFSSMENIVGYWKETISDDIKVVSKTENGSVYWVGLQRDDGEVLRYAYEVEVDEYYANKGE